MILLNTNLLVYSHVATLSSARPRPAVARLSTKREHGCRLALGQPAELLAAGDKSANLRAASDVLSRLEPGGRVAGL